MIDYNEIKAAASSGPSSVIKSIQRGELESNSNYFYIKIPISKIDTNKTIVLLNCTGRTIASGSNSTSFAESVRLSILADDSFTVSMTSAKNANNNPAFSWQVIEFN